ncbi:MAG: PQQ-binding-like beta-propeller repeat protein [Armatimonas sp.]
MDWMHWRGPRYNGSTDEKKLPVSFSPTKGVAWVTSLPGPSAATPIVCKDAVFTTAADFDKQQLLAICLDRKTGKERWRSAVGSGHKPGGDGTPVQLDERGHYAQPSPVTDGKRVFFFYGNGDLVSFDFTGRKIWQRNLQKELGDFAFQWTFSSTPLLLGEKLYLQILQRNQPVGARGKEKPESFLLCINGDDGRELWRAARPSNAIMESRESYASPIPLTTEDKKTRLLIAGGDVLSCHEVETGKELWRSGTWNESHREAFWRLVPSPVAGDGIALVCAPKRAPVYAMKLSDGTSAWKSEDRSPVTSDVPTPAFSEGKFYVLSDVRKSISCVEAKTGKIVWSVTPPGRQMCWASPTVADGKLYLMNLNGDVFVLDVSDGKVLAENAMDTEGADIRSSIAAAQGSLFIRTRDKLYCIGG